VQTRVVHITAKHHHDDPKKEWVVKIQSQSFKMEMPVIIFPKITSKDNPKKHTHNANHPFIHNRYTHAAPTNQNTWPKPQQMKINRRNKFIELPITPGPNS
jgi:hypothetical protein